jgi:hypothetical protein
MNTSTSVSTIHVNLGLVLSAGGFKSRLPQGENDNANKD